MPNIKNIIKSMDNTFFAYMAKEITEYSLCSKLENQLELVAACANSRKKFHVSLIDGKSEFFAMRCYPDLSRFNTFITKTDSLSGGEENFNKHWLIDLDKWEIEIDKNCFDPTVISFNPSELTAILLHELSHVVFSDKISERFYDSYRTHKLLLRMQEKKAMTIVQGIMYIIPTLVACGMHEWSVGKDGMIEEYICDQVFGQTEYKRHMSTALNKIVKACGTSVLLTDQQKDLLVDKDMKWCNINIIDISHRRDILQRDLLNKAALSRSKQFKYACLNILNKFGIGMSDKYTGNMITMESVIEGIDDGVYDLNGILTKLKFVDSNVKARNAMENVIESALNSTPAFESMKNKTPFLPSDYDIDSLNIQLDKMTNHNDRIYVLDLIHNRLEQISEFEEYVSYAGNLTKYSSKIAAQKEQLGQLRTAVLLKRSFKSQYDVFVKSPAGYEG